MIKLFIGCLLFIAAIPSYMIVTNLVAQTTNKSPEEKKLPKIATESERCEFKSLQMESEYSILQNRLAQAERELGTLRATLAQLSNQKTAEDIRTKRANLCKDIAELNNCQIDEKTGEVTAIKPVEKK